MLPWISLILEMVALLITFFNFNIHHSILSLDRWQPCSCSCADPFVIAQYRNPSCNITTKIANIRIISTALSLTD